MYAMKLAHILPFAKKKHRHYEKLSKKWLKKHSELQEHIAHKHRDSLEFIAKTSHHVASTSLGGLMLLTAPMIGPSHQLPAHVNTIEKNAKEFEDRVFAIAELEHVLPNTIRPLTPDEEQATIKVINERYKVTVLAEMNGIRLQRNYGYIGKEQHLSRYPGDTIYSHFQTDSEANKFADSGMAPGLGAYRYFADSKTSMTQKQIDEEKYYVAIQTFLAPGYNEHAKKYNDFFKFRKMLIVNPENGKAVVAVIGDAGPAPFTGKQLGGSPELMDYLQRVDGKSKGPVLFYFLDDPNDTIPLGPREL